MIRPVHLILMTCSIIRDLKYSLIIVFLIYCCTSGRAQGNSILVPEVLANLLPDKIEGFNLVERINGRSVKIGTLTYSMMERSFSKSKRKIRFMLFDYNNAPIMYTQSTGKWESQPQEETDDLIQRTFTVANGQGWEYHNKVSNTSQILMGIHDRFYLVINGEGVDLDLLRVIATAVDLSNFPQRDRALTDAKHR